MTGPPLLVDLALILLGATALVLVARAVGAPSIVAYILAGLILGPILGLLAVTDTLELISEVGIALLLFLVGLELSFEKVRDVGRVAVITGVVQVTLTAAVGFALGLLIGLGPVPSSFLALGLAFSSTVVVVKVLDQKRALDELYGRISVGILLVQDVVVIVALTFVAGLGRPEAMEPLAMARGLLTAFAGMGLLLVAALAAARWILPLLFGWISRSLEGLFIWSLSWCFLFILGAELLHLSLEIGAFLAGISLAQLPFNEELRRRIRPLMNFFIAVFFVTLGAQMDLGAAAAFWLEALLLSVLILVGKPILFLWLIGRQGYGERTAFLSGVTLAQISEFSFILASMGLAIGLIDATILSLIAMIGLVTISVSTYFMAYQDRLYALARGANLPRLFGARPERPAAADGPPSGRHHVIVVGMNALGRPLVEELVRRGEEILAIDTDPEKLLGLPCRTLLGNVDHPAVLEDAKLSEARLVISALQIEEANNLLAYRCRERGVPCSIHAFDQSVVSQLQEIGVDHLIQSKNSGVQEIAAELRRLGVIGLQ